MKEIITAKEFLKEFLKNNPKGTYDKCMIEFAKLHVEEFSIQASKKAKCYLSGRPGDYQSYEVDRDSIKNAYPLENIK
jgi:hypothetical protein